MEFIPALHEVGGSFCRSLSSFKILFEAIPLTYQNASDRIRSSRSERQNHKKRQESQKARKNWNRIRIREEKAKSKAIFRDRMNTWDWRREYRMSPSPLPNATQLGLRDCEVPFLRRKEREEGRKSRTRRGMTLNCGDGILSTSLFLFLFFFFFWLEHNLYYLYSDL